MTSKANESKTKFTVKKEGHGERPYIRTIKLKYPPPKHIKPGNWRDGSVVDEKESDDDDTISTNTFQSPPGPVVNLLDDAARETFPTGRPLEDPPDLIRCSICKKMILKTISVRHVNTCNMLKKQKAQRKKELKEARDRERRVAEVAADYDEEDDDGDYKTVTVIRKGKKRKAEADPDRTLKTKKKKEEPKPRVPKPRGPVDVERQCGVLKDGIPCARSLTCKSHSMGAKRAVAGRSLPYDFLLAAYQKKNQARQQKAVINANAPLEDEDSNQGPVDSDEELSSVMQGLSNWNPQPAIPPIVQIPIDRKYTRERLREQLSQATNGSTVNIFKIKVLPDDEADAVSDWYGNEVNASRKSSLTTGGRKSVGLEPAN